MRFLVHSGNSTYSTTDKKFHFSLDRRFPNPTRLRISKVNYIASTADTYPTVVYLRSAAIDDLIKTKHTVELTENAHENGGPPSAAFISATAWFREADPPSHFPRPHAPYSTCGPVADSQTSS